MLRRVEAGPGVALWTASCRIGDQVCGCCEPFEHPREIRIPDRGPQGVGRARCGRRQYGRRHSTGFGPRAGARGRRRRLGIDRMAATTSLGLVDEHPPVHDRSPVNLDWVTIWTMWSHTAVDALGTFVR